MSKLIIIPLLNDKITLFQGPTFYLDEDVFIDKLTDDEHSAFFRGLEDDFKSSIDINRTRCIKCKLSTADEDETKKVKTQATFCLNLFSELPLVTIWGGILEGVAKLSVHKIVEFEDLAGINKIKTNRFKIQSGTKRVAVSELYKKINGAISKGKETLFTLEKYNSSLLRSEFIDKLVDTTICFESLISGNTELIYRLSLYSSYITSNNANERKEIFTKMKSLYEVRSKIIHGDLRSNKIQQKIEVVKKNWADYQKILKSAVSYYILYLSQHNKEDWDKHLHNLVLGIESKAI